MKFPLCNSGMGSCDGSCSSSDPATTRQSGACCCRCPLPPAATAADAPRADWGSAGARTSYPVSKHEQLRKDTCWARPMTETWMKNAGLDAASKPSQAAVDNFITTGFRWQYIALPSTLFYMYPGDARKDPYDYDPRVRPWYVAASSGPKDVVIVIDVSGSMDANAQCTKSGMAACRMERAKAAADMVVKLLVITDFIAVVTFGNDGKQLCGDRVNPTSAESLLPKGVDKVPCGRLMRATKFNKQALRALIAGLKAGGSTNMEQGLSKGMELFKLGAEQTSGCRRAMLVLGDGDPTVGALTKALLVAKVTGPQAKLTEAKARSVNVFTYSIGSGISSSGKAILSGLACANEGSFTAITDTGNVRDTMAHFYDFFAGVNDVKKDQEIGNFIWTEPYIRDESSCTPDCDYPGADFKKAQASMAVPLWDTRYSPAKLIAVVSADFSMSVLGTVATPEEINGEILSSYNICPASSLATGCLLDKVRTTAYNSEGEATTMTNACPATGATGCKANGTTCPSPAPKGQPTADASELFCASSAQMAKGKCDPSSIFASYQGDNVCGASNYQFNPVQNGCGSCKNTKDCAQAHTPVTKERNADGSCPDGYEDDPDEEVPAGAPGPTGDCVETSDMTANIVIIVIILAILGCVGSRQGGGDKSVPAVEQAAPVSVRRAPVVVVAASRP